MGRASKKRADIRERTAGEREIVAVERFLEAVAAPFEDLVVEDEVASAYGVDLGVYSHQQAYLRWAQGYPLSALEAAAAARESVEQLVELAVAAALDAGHSWTDIGAALGVSRQAVTKRYGDLR
jgi:hypothetical protein